MSHRFPRVAAQFAITAAAATLAACAYPDPKGGAPMPLVSSAGVAVGTVSAYQTAGGVTLKLQATGMPHGVHGVHIHETGRCDAPDFKSAGSHWNPMGRKHGSANPAGPHMGDLPNVTVAANGVLDATVALAGADLTTPAGVPGALLDADGAALVVHSGADDYKTDPSGNSGERIACAILVPTAMRY